MPKPFARAVSGIAALCLSLALLPFSAPRAAAAAALEDIDGDGLNDHVIGLPWYGPDGNGAIQVFLSTKNWQDPQFITYEVVTDRTPGEFHTQFGASTLVRDLNQDGHADVIVGAPGTRWVAEDPELDGRVALFMGSATGLNPGDWLVTSGAVNDRAGTSLAVLDDGTKPIAIAVGAPGYPDEDNGRWAGAVLIFPLLEDGSPSGVAVDVTQNRPGVPGTAENGDGFGHSLAASGRTLIVGSPWEAIGSIKAAGQVTMLTFDSQLNVVRGKSIHQNTSGIPDGASTNDFFGASVAAMGNLFAVGVPGENIGDVANTGMAQAFTYSSSGTVKVVRSVHQGSSGIPGGNEKNDYFGDAVALLAPAVGVRALAVGTPWEDIGSNANAGSVTLIRVDGASFTNKSLEKGTATTPAEVAGVRETNGELGHILHTVKGATTGVDDLVIGIWSDHDMDAAAVLSRPFSSTATYLRELPPEPVTPAGGVADKARRVPAPQVRSFR